MADQEHVDSQRLSALFEIEHRLRGAESLITLRFVVTNEVRGVVDYGHAALLEPGVSGWRITALSDVPAVDRNSLFAQFVERAFAAQDRAEAGPRALDADALGEWERGVWSEVSPSSVLLAPLAGPGREPVAWLWLAREPDWSETDRFMCAHIAEVAGHAFAALAPRRDRAGWLAGLRRRRVAIGLLVLLALVLALPVHLSALAPAEIVARDPAIIAAPMDGVVERVLVEPNARVKAGQALVRMQDIEARNRYAVASEALKVAQAQYDTAQQQAFDDADSRAELAQRAAEVDLRRVQKAYAKQQLDRVVLSADHAGLAIFNDPSDWAGRPVQTGERIMQLADPDSREVRVELPVEDALLLAAGAPVKLFLDSHPLAPVRGEVTRVAYKPVANARDQMVYRVTARLSEQRDYLRIGLRGTAKISGGRVPLAYYLLRRPLTALRQMIGY
ncbi:HlyD family efflux transporter periplasmic adaptor subunit [Salinisphaera sp. T31B1]|uniref:efflux RND transporter periplasmic adaptor subunit n=1 Tax=Salinisphaera sp. T31B1 TaxID=727963 RepID=UPI00333F3E2A